MKMDRIQYNTEFKYRAAFNRNGNISTDALTCSMANCQYGCDVVKGEVRCRCPSPGLQLAPDGRTCIGKSRAIHIFFSVFSLYQAMGNTGQFFQSQPSLEERD